MSLKYEPSSEPLHVSVKFTAGVWWWQGRLEGPTAVLDPEVKEGEEAFALVRGP